MYLTYVLCFCFPHNIFWFPTMYLDCPPCIWTSPCLWVSQRVFLGSASCVWGSHHVCMFPKISCIRYQMSGIRYPVCWRGCYYIRCKYSLNVESIVLYSCVFSKLLNCFCSIMQIVWVVMVQPTQVRLCARLRISWNSVLELRFLHCTSRRMLMDLGQTLSPGYGWRWHRIVGQTCCA